MESHSEAMQDLADRVGMMYRAENPSDYSTKIPYQTKNGKETEVNVHLLVEDLGFGEKMAAKARTALPFGSDPPDYKVVMVADHYGNTASFALPTPDGADNSGYGLAHWMHWVLDEATQKRNPLTDSLRTPHTDRDSEKKVQS